MQDFNGIFLKYSLNITVLRGIVSTKIFVIVSRLVDLSGSQQWNAVKKREILEDFKIQ